MPCKRCTELPKINFKGCQVYLYIPTKHHIEPIENLLEASTIAFEFLEDYFLFEVEDFKGFIQKLNSIGFSPLDQRDIRLMPIEGENKLDFKNLEYLKSLKTWIDLYDGEMVLEVLKEERLKILFQPIIDIKEKRIYGYEALTRGVTSKDSMIPPNVLFKKAKAMDLIFYLDRLCRETIIKRAAEENLREKLFINFLPTSIYNPRKCLETTNKAVEKTQLYPDQITFEVVETEYIEDFDHLNYILDYYKEKGYATALDDMGSGYANKASLSSLKPDYMKIDMAIVQGIHNNQEKQEKLKDYLKLIEGKDIRPLAEGVETKEDFEYIMKQGIDLVQGYYFAKPSEDLVTLDLEKLI